MRKVAIIDDAEDNRDFLYYFLRDEYEVSRHPSGEDALEQFQQDPPDLVILDITLRGMDGVEVLSKIRERRALENIPVIAVTAHAMNGDREKYLAAGFTDYISKPILDMDLLLNSIRRRLPSRSAG